MRIAVYDTLHHETLSALLGIFETQELHVFTSHEFYELLHKKHPAVQWHTGDVQTMFSLPLLIRKKNRQYHFDLVIFNTVHKHHLLYAYAAKGRSKLIITLHEASMLQPAMESKGMKAFARLAGQRLLNKMASAFFVLSSEVKKYIADHALTRKPVWVIPGGIMEESVSPTLEGDLVVTIPGTIDPARRNYREILLLVPLLPSTGRRIAIVLLGGAKHQQEMKSIAEEASHLNPGVDIHLFDTDFISQAIFDQWLRSSHFIYLPLRPSVVKKNSVERYGITKISGGFFDAVRFAKPILLPAAIPVAREFMGQTFSYSSIQELAAIINQAASDPDYLQELHRLSSVNATAFTASHVAEEILPSIEKLIANPPA